MQRGQVLAIVSGVLAAGLAVLYALSFRAGGGVALLLDDGRMTGAFSGNGQVVFVWTDIRLGPARAWSAQAIGGSAAEAARWKEALKGGAWSWERGGFLLADAAPDAFGVPGARAGAAGVPYWALVAVAAVPPVMWGRRRWTAARRRRCGRCPACGYDRRGNPDGKCPECGHEG